MMDDVPGEIEAKAKALCDRLQIPATQGTVFVIADEMRRGIMAEREQRNAEIANLLEIIASRNAALERYENGEMGP